MSKPFITFALADDGNSIFVYEGDIVKDEQNLTACIGVQREDMNYQLEQYLDAAVAAVLDSDNDWEG